MKTVVANLICGATGCFDIKSRGLCNVVISLKLILNPNFVKSRLPITYLSVIQSFWIFAQNTAMMLLRPVQNKQKWLDSSNGCCGERDFAKFELRWVLGGYSILHSLSGRSNLVNSCVYYVCQTSEIFQVLPYSVNFKAPKELWNSLT